MRLDKRSTLATARMLIACWWLVSVAPLASAQSVQSIDSPAYDPFAPTPVEASPVARNVPSPTAGLQAGPLDQVPFNAQAPWPDTPPTVPVPRVAVGSPVPPAADPNNLASPQMVAWLKRLVRENLPETYENDKKWNQQKEVWDGVDFSRDGLKIKTKRKHKLVNHGTWTRYRLQIVDPDNRLDIQFHTLQLREDGKIAFDVSVEMLLDVFGRMSQWVRDVQLISLSANADAVCKLSVQGTVAFQLNPLRVPPDIMIKPNVDAARVDIAYFRVRRISQLGGPAAAQLGNGLRAVLESKLEESNEKLPEKMNRQLAKHSDRMVFSMQDWLQSKLPLPDAPQK